VASTVHRRVDGRGGTAAALEGRAFARELLPAIALASMTVLVAVLLKLALGPSLADRPFLLLGGAVVVSAWYGGARAGLPALVLSVVAAAWFFLPPPGPAVASAADLWALLLFVGEMLLVTGLLQQARDARTSSERAARTALRLSAERHHAELLARQMETGLASLNRLGTALVSELEPREVAALAAQGAAAVSGATWSALAFERFGGGGQPLRQGIGSPEATGALLSDAQALRNAAGEPGVLRVDDVLREAALTGLAARRLPVRSLIVARLEGRSGRGVLALAHPQPAFFDARHERLIALVAVQAASALDNAHHDSDAQQALADAQQAARVKDEFLSTLSHELRTPLNAIIGWAHLLQGRQLGPDDTRRAVETIVRNATLQESMIRELLDMSSLLNGRLRLHAAPLDLRGVVEDAVATGRSYAHAKGVELRLRSPNIPVTVVADAARLQQVVWSLLSNAVKFTPAGGRVAVEVYAADTVAEVVVRDSGAGMDSAFLSRLFSRFSRADASSTRPTRGLGLGLAVARGLVELHDGELTAESPGPGLGSTFTVRLPLARDARNRSDAGGPTQRVNAGGGAESLPAAAHPGGGA
jgi:signal transduction histidine kinase